MCCINLVAWRNFMGLNVHCGVCNLQLVVAVTIALMIPLLGVAIHSTFLSNIVVSIGNDLSHSKSNPILLLLRSYNSFCAFTNRFFNVFATILCVFFSSFQTCASTIGSRGIQLSNHVR